MSTNIDMAFCTAKINKILLKKPKLRYIWTFDNRSQTTLESLDLLWSLQCFLCSDQVKCTRGQKGLQSVAKARALRSDRRVTHGMISCISQWVLVVTMTTLFDRQKADKLSKVDLSRKGSVDAPIFNFLKNLNAHPDYVSLSSCSGRIIIFISAENVKKVIWLIKVHSSEYALENQDRVHRIDEVPVG